jgi:Pumilio-family RNA binding repeat
VIERGKPEDREKIISGVLGQVLELSKHKFASNVVEKCVAFGSYDDRQQIIDEIMEVNTDSSSPLLAMMKDGFGNYVIQKLLDVTEGEQRVQLVARIKPQLLALKRYTYGKHLASSMSLTNNANISRTSSRPLGIARTVVKHDVASFSRLDTTIYSFFRLDTRQTRIARCPSHTYRLFTSSPSWMKTPPSSTLSHLFHQPTILYAQLFIITTNILLYISPSLLQHVCMRRAG